LLNDEISIENIVDLVYYKINECVCFVEIAYTRKEIVMYSVTIQEIKDEFELVNLTDEIDLKAIEIESPEVNRPALQLAGFFDYFDSERVQLMNTLISVSLLQNLDRKLLKSFSITKCLV
jgi:hypothetical protein